jgi:hypothetical protein
LVQAWEVEAELNNHIAVSKLDDPAFAAKLTKSSGQQFGYDGQAVTAIPVTEVHGTGIATSSLVHVRLALTTSQTTTGSAVQSECVRYSVSSNKL